jgi:glycosyltransferase involved in cell wall biosynthesis
LIAETECSLVIPAYNEEERILALLTDLSDFQGEILCVCDGCDRTPAIIREFTAVHPAMHLRLLTFSDRLGKGGAVIAGMRAADLPFIGFMDADGSTPLSQMRLLFAALEDCDAVLGSRWVDGAVIGVRQSLGRRLQSRAFNIAVRILFGLPFRDTQCGAKTFRRDALTGVMPLIRAKDFTFDVDLLWRFHRKGFRMREIAIAWADRGGSKVEMGDALGMLKNLIRLRLLRS